MEVSKLALRLSLSPTAWTFVVLLGLFVFSRSAAAQSFSYGGTVFGKPSCVATDVLQSEDVTCVARGPNNDLYSIRFNPRTGATLGFQLLGFAPGFTTPIVGNPSCVGATFIVCVVRGLDNVLRAFTLDPLTMTTSTRLQCLIDQVGEQQPVAGDPSCVHTGVVFMAQGLVFPFEIISPRIVCGVRGKDNGLYIVRFNATDGDPGINQSSVIRSAPTEVIVGDPSCALVGGVTLTPPTVREADIICAARGPASSLAVVDVSIFAQPGESSTRARDLEASFRHLYNLSPSRYMAGDPSCASTEVSTQFIPSLSTDVLTASPFVTCGVRGTDSALYVIRAGWQRQMPESRGPLSLGVFHVVPFSPPGGILTDNASCASTRLQVVTCGVRGTNGVLHMIDFQHGNWCEYRI